MYRPKHFDVDEVERLHALIRDEPFGTLVSRTPDGFVASHIPFVLRANQGSRGALFGHVARANRQWESFDGRTEVLATFHGPHAYVSPAWMESPSNVPTWNYVAVHVYGCPRVLESPSIVRERMDELVAQSEANRASPWSTTDAPADFVDGMLRGIVAFDLEIERIEGKWKLSQNKSEADRRRAIEGLEAEGGATGCDTAAEMRRALDAD